MGIECGNMGIGEGRDKVWEKGGKWRRAKGGKWEVREKCGGKGEG